MGRRVEQRALVVLAVDLDQAGGDGAQRLGADALVVDEGAGAPVGELDPAQDQFAFGAHALIGERGEDGVIGRQVEARRHLPLRFAVAGQRAVAARAERERQSVEQDRLSRPGFAGEDGEAVGELEVQLVDQHDVADREPGEHGLWPRRLRTARRNGRAWKSRTAGFPSATGRRSSADCRRPCTTRRRGSCGRARRRRSALRR